MIPTIRNALKMANSELNIVTNNIANAGSTALMVHAMLERRVDLIYQTCIGCRPPRTLAVNRQALKRRSNMATSLRPVAEPGFTTPCSGGVAFPFGCHDGFL